VYTLREPGLLFALLCTYRQAEVIIMSAMVLTGERDKSGAADDAFAA
jgi:hypothetical protein